MQPKHEGGVAFQSRVDLGTIRCNVIGIAWTPMLGTNTEQLLCASIDLTAQSSSLPFRRFSILVRTSLDPLQDFFATLPFLL